MIYIFLGVVVFFCILLLVGTLINSKFKLAVIKIEKAEEDIDIYLQKKYDLLSRAKAVVIKELKLESFLPEIDQNFSEISNFSENDILRKAYNDLLKTMDDHDKLLKSEALVSILEDLDQNEEDIVGAIKFYNDTVVDYNQLVISFPSLIIAFFKRYKKKEFYNNEKREMHNILS